MGPKINFQDPPTVFQSVRKGEYFLRAFSQMERVGGEGVGQSHDLIVGLNLERPRQFIGRPVSGKCGLEEESSFHDLCESGALVGSERGF